MQALWKIFILQPQVILCFYFPSQVICTMLSTEQNSVNSTESPWLFSFFFLSFSLSFVIQWYVWVCTRQRWKWNRVELNPDNNSNFKKDLTERRDGGGRTLEYNEAFHQFWLLITCDILTFYKQFRICHTSMIKCLSLSNLFISRIYTACSLWSLNYRKKAIMIVPWNVIIDTFCCFYSFSLNKKVFYFYYSKDNKCLQSRFLCSKFNYEKIYS